MTTLLNWFRKALSWVRQSQWLCYPSATWDPHQGETSVVRPTSPWDMRASHGQMPQTGDHERFLDSPFGVPWSHSLACPLLHACHILIRCQGTASPLETGLGVGFEERLCPCTSCTSQKYAEVASWRLQTSNLSLFHLRLIRLRIYGVYATWSDLGLALGPFSKQKGISAYFQGCRIVLGFVFASGFGCFFGFLSWYHLLCNYLQQFGTRTCQFAWYLLHFGMVTLHIAWFICYIWPWSPSILHGICYILALQPLICMVFARFWYFKRWCGFLEGSLGFHLGFHLRFHLGFHLGFHLQFHLRFHFSFFFFGVSFRVSLGFHLRFHFRCHLGFL